MQGEEIVGRAATAHPTGEDARVDSATDPKLHHEFHREIAPVLAEVVAAALASGTLQVGGRFRLAGGCLRREGRA